MSFREARKFTHHQTSATATWVITHNLNIAAPIVDCFVDFNGVMTKILPLSVEATSPSVATISWSQPRTGRAIIT